MKVINLNCGWRREYESDLRSNKHYLSSSENRAWKNFRPEWDLNPWPYRPEFWRSLSYSHISSIIEKDFTNGKENNYVPNILMEAEGNYKKTFLDWLILLMCKLRF